MLTYIWIAMVVLSVVYGAATGRIEAVGQGAMDGAKAAVNLCMAMLAPMCLWSGLTELLTRVGALGGLNRLLSPVMGRLFPEAKRHGDTALIAANIGANVLGLGNAATPLSIRASKALGKRCEGGVASAELCRLIVLNTASLQLLPMTVCSIRAGLGSEAPFDIVPAVWIASGAALCVGLGAMFLAEKLFGKGRKRK